MTQEIESVKPALTVILDDGDFILSSTGPIGKAMVQAVLPLAAAARKVTIISDGEMKVMKRNGTGAIGQATQPKYDVPKQPTKVYAGEDVQDQFVADLESGETGEAAMGEFPSPTPGPSDPVPVPAAPKTPAKRKPVIFQDAAAPPAPELAVAEMERLLEEAAQAEQESAKVAEDRRFQQQQAVQAGQPAEEVTAEEPAAAKPRKRERSLATTGRPCGRCGGGGQIQGEAGYVGACPVCQGQGQVKTWDRALKVR